MDLRQRLRELVHPAHAALIISESLRELKELVPDHILDAARAGCATIGMTDPTATGFAVCAVASLWVFSRSKSERRVEEDIDRVTELVAELSTVRAALANHRRLDAIHETWRNTPEFILLAVCEDQTLKLDSLDRQGREALVRIAALIQQCEGIESDLRSGLSQAIDLLGSLHARVEAIRDALGPPVKPVFQGSTPLATDSDRLRFERRAATYVGRNEEMASLTTWLFSSRQFDWWLWYGPAGTGKSRLGLELILRALRHGWDAAYFSLDVTYDTWRAWSPDRNTLIIFDYAKEAPQRIGAAIESLSSQPKEYSVRFLLLERTFDEKDTWIDELKYACGDVPWRSASKQPKLLEEVSGDEFSNISFEVYANRCKATGKQATIASDFKPLFESSMARLIRTSRAERQLSRRPLFAHFLGEAIADVGFDGLNRWDLPTLSNWWLRREFRHWRRAGVTEREINLLLLATVAGGISDPERLGFAKEFPLTDISSEPMVPNWTAIEPQAAANRYGPLQPDILGEALILERLLEGSKLQLDTSTRPGPSQVTRRLLSAVWVVADREDGGSRWLAYDRCTQDFPDHPALQDFFDLAVKGSLLADAIRADAVLRIASSNKAGLADRLIEEISCEYIRAGALLNKGRVFYGEERFEEAIECFDAALAIQEAELEERVKSLFFKGCALGSLGRKHEKILSLDLAIALPESSGYYRAQSLLERALELQSLGRHSETIASCELLINLEDATSDQQRRALFHEAESLRKIGKADDALLIYNIIIRNTKFSKDDEALAIFCKGSTLDELGRTEEAIEHFDALLSMPEAAIDRRVRALGLKGAILGRLGHLSEEIQCYDDILILSNVPIDLLANTLHSKGLTLSMLNRFEDALKCYQAALDLDDIPARYAIDALEGMAIVFSMVGRLDEARNVLDRAESMPELQAQNPDKFISLRETIDSFEGCAEFPLAFPMSE